MSYRLIDLDQRTSEWLQWRAGKDNASITATAASALMGVDKYTDVLSMWKERVGFVAAEDAELTEAVIHGRDTEDHAREELIKATGIAFKPACIESVEFPFIKASLDGINEGLRLGLEIKCPRYMGSFKNQVKELPLDYYAQIQAQLMITGFEAFIFYSYFGNSEDLKIVRKSESYQKELLKRCIVFNTCVISKIEPTEDVFFPYVHR